MDEDEKEGGPYITSTRIRTTNSVCNNTLRGFADKGTVRCIRIGDGGKRLYSLPDVRKALGVQIKAGTSLLKSARQGRLRPRLEQKTAA